MGVAQNEYPTKLHYTHTGPTSNLGFARVYMKNVTSHNQHSSSWTDSNQEPLDPETDTLPTTHYFLHVS